MRLIFLNQHTGWAGAAQVAPVKSGNANELRDVGASPGKRCLFFFTAFKIVGPGSRLTGDRVYELGKHRRLGGVRCACDDP